MIIKGKEAIDLRGRKGTMGIGWGGTWGGLEWKRKKERDTVIFL